MILPFFASGPEKENAAQPRRGVFFGINYFR